MKVTEVAVDSLKHSLEGMVMSDYKVYANSDDEVLSIECSFVPGDAFKRYTYEDEVCI